MAPMVEPPSINNILKLFPRLIYNTIYSSFESFEVVIVYGRQ
jgi:hypothetical protein